MARQNTYLKHLNEPIWRGNCDICQKSHIWASADGRNFSQISSIIQKKWIMGNVLNVISKNNGLKQTTGFVSIWKYTQSVIFRWKCERGKWAKCRLCLSSLWCLDGVSNECMINDSAIDFQLKFSWESFILGCNSFFLECTKLPRRMNIDFLIRFLCTNRSSRKEIKKRSLYLYHWNSPPALNNSSLCQPFDESNASEKCCIKWKKKCAEEEWN